MKLRIDVVGDTAAEMAEALYTLARDLEAASTDRPEATERARRERTLVAVPCEDQAKWIKVNRRIAKDFGCKVAARDGVAALVAALEAKMTWAKFVLLPPPGDNVVPFRRA
jgi:hypothetical protein